jgi:RNA polymerase-binding transcription factor DksA
MPAKKKAAKPAAKKAAVKKPAPTKKAAAKKVAPKPAAKKAAASSSSSKAKQKPAVKKVITVAQKVKSVIRPAAVHKQPEVKKPEIAKPTVLAPIVVPKPVNPAKPGFKPVTNTPPPVPKKMAEPAKATKPLVIPEIKTKTARAYQPDFTKSVLDQPIEVSNGPTMRYSDNDLSEFRAIIQKKLDVAKKELTYLQGLITRKDEMGGDNDDARYMTMEDGSMSMEREQLSQMASRQITFIDHLEKAMMRIENKTYGICRVTGKLIDKARLKAVPHATLSIEAKQMQK